MGSQWDDIYRSYQQGGDAWATLSEGIHPAFIAFLQASDFPKRSAFDIGCGTGKYMSYLHSLRFSVSGIDSSETAVQMTREALPGATVDVAEMFAFEIPKNTYDLIISISTIHHGRKAQVAVLIGRIHDALCDGGKMFITVPEWKSADHWKTFKDHELIEPGTLAPLTGPEKGLAHSFYTETEVKKLFSAFSGVSMHVDEIGRWIVTGSK